MEYGSPAAVWGQSEQDMDIVRVLQSYKREAKQARDNGPNPRTAIWDRNLDLYWNRVDFSGKASWQAKEVMPEVPSYVDRFAAAIAETAGTEHDGDVRHVGRLLGLSDTKANIVMQNLRKKMGAQAI